MKSPKAINKTSWNFQEKITFSLDTREISADQGLCDEDLQKTGRVLSCKMGWRVFRAKGTVEKCTQVQTWEHTSHLSREKRSLDARSEGYGLRSSPLFFLESFKLLK